MFNPILQFLSFQVKKLKSMLPPSPHPPTFNTHIALQVFSPNLLIRNKSLAEICYFFVQITSKIQLVGELLFLPIVLTATKKKTKKSISFNKYQPKVLLEREKKQDFWFQTLSSLAGISTILNKTAVSSSFVYFVSKKTCGNF